MSPRKQARDAGYYIRPGRYANRSSDCAGRWYVGHRSENFAPEGPGYRSKLAAWTAAVEHGLKNGRIKL